MRHTKPFLQQTCTGSIFLAGALATILSACSGSSEKDGGGDGGGNVNIPATTGTLSSITLSPTTAGINQCASQVFAATANYSDGSSQTLTPASYTWGIAGPAIAAVSAPGVVIGTGSGTGTMNTTVTAYSGSIAGNATLTVTPLQLLGLTVSSAASSVAAGSNVQLSASGTCPDGVTQVNNTTSVSWASSNTGVATVDSFGNATAVAAGSAVITATAMPGSVAASAVLNVQ
jgi:hypothetical protein